MRWTFVVPVKAAAERKSRLAPALNARRRLELSEQLYRHVVHRISDSQLAEQIFAVSPVLPQSDIPVQVWVQRDTRLNSELQRIREAVAGALMVVNADLPLLEAADLHALAEAAEEQGCALAPDRHGTGTNAVALLPGAPFDFSFGPDSLGLHLASTHKGAGLVRRAGLAYDVDTLSDIRAILALGQPLEPDVARLLHVPEDKAARAALAVGD